LQFKKKSGVVFWTDAKPELEALQLFSSMIGAIAVKLTGEKIIKSFSDDIFFLGLLQNIGFLILSFCMPKQYDLVMVGFHKDASQVIHELS
jgi:hypothetical protein